MVVFIVAVLGCLFAYFFGVFMGYCLYRDDD